MVPDIAGTGHSFKGALAYYLHDKRANDALPQLASSERVAWTETRNLATDDMHTAQRVMIATARQADELKARAGVKNTGRKSTKVVYAYSLSWHPDEAASLTHDDMVRAADASLKLLGAENRQAVIVCHTDQQHPHVHVIVNRVDPEDGRMLDGKNDRFKLSDWANAYERERGRILTPRREEKRQQREQNADKAKRREYTEQKRAAAKEQEHDPKTRAAMLRELGASQKVQHRDQWRDLAAREKTGRDQIYRSSAAAIAETIERHKAECKPIWAQHFRGARAEEWRFSRREQSVSGVVVNAFVAARHQQSTGQLNDRGLLTATLANVFSSQAREHAFMQAQELTRQQLASRLKSIGDKEVADLKGQRSQELAQHRDLFQTERGALIERQDGERAKLRETWKQLYGDRSEWPRPGRERGAKPYRAHAQRDGQKQDPASAIEAQHGPEISAANKLVYQPTDRKAAYADVRAQMQRGMPPVLNARDRAGNNLTPDRAAYLSERPATAPDPQREMPPVLNARDKTGNDSAPDGATYLSERPATAPDPQRGMPPVLNRKEAGAQQKQEAEREKENQNSDKGKENKPLNRPAPSRGWEPQR